MEDRRKDDRRKGEDRRKRIDGPWEGWGGFDRRKGDRRQKDRREDEKDKKD